MILCHAKSVCRSACSKRFCMSCQSKHTPCACLTMVMDGCRCHLCQLAKATAQASRNLHRLHLPQTSITAPPLVRIAHTMTKRGSGRVQQMSRQRRTADTIIGDRLIELLLSFHEPSTSFHEPSKLCIRRFSMRYPKIVLSACHYGAWRASGCS